MRSIFSDENDDDFVKLQPYKLVYNMVEGIEDKRKAIGTRTTRTSYMYIVN